MTDGDDDLEPRTLKALADTARLTGVACRACGTPLCGHAAVAALVLGYKAVPLCLPCAAVHMREPLPPLRERVYDYVRHHDCFLSAWRHASALEAAADPERPACVFAIDGAAARGAAIVDAAAAPGEAPATVVYDAGAMGCGDLVLELRQRLRALPAGGILELRAEDPGAPIDLPAWCSMTGHTLLSAQHPIYRIRRKA